MCESKDGYQPLTNEQIWGVPDELCPGQESEQRDYFDYIETRKSEIEAAGLVNGFAVE